jgi:hypothetical protein
MQIVTDDKTPNKNENEEFCLSQENVGRNRTRPAGIYYTDNVFKGPIKRTSMNRRHHDSIPRSTPMSCIMEPKNCENTRSLCYILSLRLFNRTRIPTIHLQIRRTYFNNTQSVFSSPIAYACILTFMRAQTIAPSSMNFTLDVDGEERNAKIIV